MRRRATLKTARHIVSGLALVTGRRRDRAGPRGAGWERMERAGPDHGLPFAAAQEVGFRGAHFAG